MAWRSVLRFAALAVLVTAVAALNCTSTCTYNNIVSPLCINGCNVCGNMTSSGCSTYYQPYWTSTNTFAGYSCGQSCPLPWWAWLLIGIGIFLFVVAVGALVYFCLSA